MDENYNDGYLIDTHPKHTENPTIFITIIGELLTIINDWGQRLADCTWFWQPRHNICRYNLAVADEQNLNWCAHVRVGSHTRSDLLFVLGDCDCTNHVTPMRFPGIITPHSIISRSNESTPTVRSKPYTFIYRPPHNIVKQFQSNIKFVFAIWNRLLYFIQSQLLLKDMIRAEIVQFQFSVRRAGSLIQVEVAVRERGRKLSEKSFIGWKSCESLGGWKRRRNVTESWVYCGKSGSSLCV